MNRIGNVEQNYIISKKKAWLGSTFPENYDYLPRLSGNSNKVRKLGAYDYISKPFYLDSILQKVEKPLEGGNKKAGN